MERIVDVQQGTHRYGSTVALHGVDLTVRRGECVALLGPNGAGKTTLVGLVTGLLRAQGPTRVRVAGGDPRRAVTRRRFGVVQQSVGLPRVLRVGELVRGAAVRAGGEPRAAAPVLAEVGITDLASRPARRLSGGEQQRLLLAMAFVGDPWLLVLDEPTVGLDVTARRRFWRTLESRRRAGAGVLLTTHVIEEAAAVADRVVILDEGRVLADDTPSEVAAELPDRTIFATTRLEESEVAALPDVLSVEQDRSTVRIATRRAESVVRRLLSMDPSLSDLRVEANSLEQALVAMTLRGGEEAA